MISMPCQECGRRREEVTAKCPHCGQTAWALLVIWLIVGSFFLLGGIASISSTPSAASDPDRVGLIFTGVLFSALGLAAFLFPVVWNTHLRNRKKAEGSAASEEKGPSPVTPGVGAGKILWGYEVADRRTPAMVESDDEMRKDLQDQYAGEGFEVVFFRSGEWPGSQIEIKSMEHVVLAYEVVLPFIQAHMKNSGLQMKVGAEPIYKGFDPNSFTLFYLFEVEPETVVTETAQPPESRSVQTEPALWAYMAQGPVVLVGGQTDEDLKRKIRQEFAVEGLTPLFFAPGDWDAPKVSSLSKEDLASAFPQIVARVQAHMAKSGLPPVDRKQLVGTAEVRTNPSTGTLIFVFKVRPPVKSEGEGPGRKAEADRDFREREETNPADECHFCGKTLRDGPEPKAMSTSVPGLEAVTISLSDDEDPFEAMQKAAERMLASKLVCGSCGSVFCMECGGEEGQPSGEKDAICPTCSQVKPSDLAQDLLALRSKVEGLLKEFPRFGGAAGAGADRAEKQVPWICRELGAASEALVSGRDPTGKPITNAQVSGGLKKLVEYVRNPDYGTVMEIVYPGIDPPLQACMDQLEAIVSEIEAT